MPRLKYTISRRKLLHSISLLALCTISTNVAACQDESSKHTSSIRKPISLGYYPSFKEFDPTEIDMAQYTHICHAFAEVSKNSPLQFPSEESTRKLITAAHSKKTKVLLSIGGADSNAALCAKSTKALVDQLIQRVHDFHYDGVDVDWEAPENTEQASKMSALVQLLRKRMPNALITMAVSAEDYSGKWFLTEDLLPYVDWLNIMTYDFCGPWVDKVLHNAPLPEIKKSIAYWKSRGWPGEKLLLGIPNYGRRIHATRFGDPAPKGTYVGDEVNYIDTEKLIASGWTKHFDAYAQSPYLVNSSGGEMITYDDKDSVERKAQFAETSGLRGFFFWEITSDFDGRTNVLAHAAHKGWKH